MALVLFRASFNFRFSVAIVATSFLASLSLVCLLVLLLMRELGVSFAFDFAFERFFGVSFMFISSVLRSSVRRSLTVL